LIADGNIALQIKGIDFDKNEMLVECLNDAEMGEQKNVHLPGATITLPAVSKKDREDLLFGVKQRVDMIAASFIRSADDVFEIRGILGENGKRIQIISKIESTEGLENFDKILQASDGIMVARGDLGVELPMEQIFVAQKMMVSKCNAANKPVITATQMLESMISNPRPTRAEVSDVANAVLDGSDCVMLSGESAKGNYPVETVSMMHRICREAESAIYYKSLFHALRDNTPKPLSMEEAVASAAVTAAFESDVGAIIVLTTSGNSARLVSKYRPPCPVLCVTRDAQVSRQLHLYRSLVSLYYDQPKKDTWQDDVDVRVNYAIEQGTKRGMLKKGVLVVALQGWKGGVGYTNTLRLLQIE